MESFVIYKGKIQKDFVSLQGKVMAIGVIAKQETNQTINNKIKWTFQNYSHWRVRLPS